jgi:DNA (cytosine-5)-methyltransferase 1
LRQLTCGSLFAGIGGFDLGFERAGIKTIWQVEIDDKCRRRLAIRFPGAKQYGDIRECGADNLARVDVIAGGFPCQPFSQAGSRQGKDDNRYLWPEMLRIVAALRPAYVVAENVSGLLSLEDGRILDEVYDSLEAEAYETLPPLVVPACAVGAGHRRDRVWIIAHAPSDIRRTSGDGGPEPSDSSGEANSNTAGGIRQRPASRESGHAALSREIITADPKHDGSHLPKADASEQGGNEQNNGLLVGVVRYASIEGFPDWAGGEVGQPSAITEFERPGGREIERDFRGMAHGVSARVDRLKGLGNAIVPQIAEWIGRRIIEAEVTDSV